MENLPAEQDQDEIIIKCSLEEITKAFFRDYEIIWSDPNVNSEENQKHMAQLEKLCKVKTFAEWKEAEDYLRNAQTICHVIDSGANRDLLVKEFFSSENVPRRFAFSRDEEYQPRVVCTETKVEDAVSQIQKNLLEWNRQSVLKLDLPAFSPIFNDWDKSQINHLHLFLKVIPSFNNRAQAKRDFLNLSREIYSDEEKNIADFEETYNDYDKEAILKWYTRESFLYKMINNCLRIATSDSIQWSRFILKDVENAIRDQYQAKSKNLSGLLYRGAYLSDEEWSSLKANVNKEIEMHGFLSVSKEKKIALNFVKIDPNQKVFITVIIPKGPNEEKQGFAEVEEFSDFPIEKEVLFNVRSRFTVLETEEMYSEDEPYRHLVLLYGAQGLRRHITEKNPIQEISIEENRYCSHCNAQTENLLFLSITEKIYYCQNCLDDNYSGPFLCVSITRAASAIEIKGFLIMNTNQIKVPLYGYKCSECGIKNQKRYFVCTGCNMKWCENCFGKQSDCIDSEHSVIFENYPFSFWYEKMSENELNHLKFQNDFVAKDQAEMYIETHEYEKALEYYKLYITQNESKDKLAGCYKGLGEVYNKQGEYKKALESHLKSLEISKAVHGENSSEVATAFSKVGGIYSSQGEYKKALECYIKCLEISKSIYGENPNSDVATFDEDLGHVYCKQGEFKKALECHQKSLDTKKSIYGVNHPKVANSYNNIGLVCQSQREYQKALEYLLKGLEIRTSVYGENHPSIATSYNNVGVAYNSLGESQKALKYYLKSLSISKSINGENHISLASSFHNIALIYKRQGEFQNSLVYSLKSVGILKLVHGENHPDLATCYCSIGMLYYLQGQFQKAIEYYLKSLDIQKSVHGEKPHPSIALSYHNIAEIYNLQQDYDTALEYYLKALEIFISVYGENHTQVATSYNSIAMIYNRQGEPEKALEYLGISLNIKKSLYGENRHSIATTYSSFATVYNNQAKSEKALEYSLEILKSVDGKKKPEIAVSYNRIGLVYYHSGEYEKALEYYLKALEIGKIVHGENRHPTIASIYHSIAMIYEGQEECQKALEYYEKSLNIFQTVYGEDHRWTIISREKVAKLNEDDGERGSEEDLSEKFFE